MSDIIHLLPDSIANQIAAGEVIQRPSSVVKELVENAIDAGASSVQVVIRDAGKTLIQVIDDGKGMSETDARMAFERHATSKISSAEDLFSLQTMGFRGEALASIAAIAHVELRTKQTDAVLGVKIAIASSKIELMEPITCDNGSSFSVKNLFFNVPARRKFLKSNDTEFRNIISEFERIALVNPTVGFNLVHNDVEVISLESSVLRQRIISVYGKSLNHKLLPLEVHTSLVDLVGFVGRPDSTRKRGALNYFFVNGRFMKHPFFHKALMASYSHLIPAGEFPDYFIYLTIDPSTIDVNIHPTKTEIKFENEQPIWQIIQSAVKEALAKSSSIPSIDFDLQDSLSIPVFTDNMQQEKRYSPTVDINTSYNPFESTSSTTDWSTLYADFEKSKELAFDDTFNDDTFNTGLSNNESSNFNDSIINDELDVSEDSLEIQSIGSFVSDLFTRCYQYKSRYIITSLKSGLVLIDQNRAHVRILYDKFYASIKYKSGNSQRLIFPEIIRFTQSEASILPAIIDDLSFAGVELNDLGDNSFAIAGLPSGFENSDHVTLVRDIVSRALEVEQDVCNEISETVALSLARASAIPYGKTLSNDEMDHLLADLFSSSSSDYTPDGKIIISVISDDDIYNRFKR